MSDFYYINILKVTAQIVIFTVKLIYAIILKKKYIYFFEKTLWTPPLLFRS